MCGHVGILGNLALKDEKTMKALLLFDYFRGPDSTGLTAVRTSGQAVVVKAAGSPLDLFDRSSFTAALSGYSSFAFLGHNRLATKGVVNNINAHPFFYETPDGGYVVGAHNGTLEVSSWRALEQKLGRTYEVDSKAIIDSIATFGIDETVPLLEGAWALVWYDSRDKSVNILRNKERPLWYAREKQGKQLFYASEHWMIESALKSQGGYAVLTDKEGFGYYPFKEDVLYKVDLKALSEGLPAEHDFSVKTLKGKEPTPAQKSHPFTGGYHIHRGSGASGTTSTSMYSPPKKDSVGKSSTSSATNVVTLTVTKDAPFGEYLSQEEFDKLSKYGCSYCSEDVSFDDIGLTVYKDSGVVLCPGCSTSTSTRIYA